MLSALFGAGQSFSPQYISASVGSLLIWQPARLAGRAATSGHTAQCLLTMVFVAQLSTSLSHGQSFNIHKHLGTRTRYVHAAPIPHAPHIRDLPDPDGFIPVHLYLLSRHGTRWPTKKRMKQIGALEGMLRSAGVHERHPWMRGWRSPYKDSMVAAGELHPVGEEELWALGTRLRHRFPQLLEEPYLPERFPIVSTQVPRAVASATAFASGFFPQLPSLSYTDGGVPIDELQPDRGDIECDLQGSDSMCMNSGQRTNQGTLVGPTRPQPVSLTMLPKLRDPLLRFFDMCPAFLRHEDFVERWLATWMRGNWHVLGQRLQQRLKLTQPLAPCMVDALWQLCQEEVGLWGLPNRTCALFTPRELLLLEWQSDVRVVETMAWGAPVNYNMAAHLAGDLRDTLKGLAGMDGAPHLASQRARLLFAHAETIVPFATLLGLFWPQAGSELQGPAVGEGQALEGLREHWVEREVLEADSFEEDVPLLLADPDEGCVGSKRLTQLLPVPQGWTPRIPLHPSRWWRGATVAPYGANLAIITYKRVNTTHNGGGNKWVKTSGQNSRNGGVHAADGWGDKEQGGNGQNGNISQNGSISHISQNDDITQNGDVSRNGDIHQNGDISQNGDTQWHDVNASSSTACTTGSREREAGSGNARDYVVRLLYNEQVVPFPGCGSALDCPLEVALNVLDAKVTEENLRLVRGLGEAQHAP